MLCALCRSNRAIELACTAEAFVTGSLPPTPTDTHVNRDPPTIQGPETTNTAARESTNTGAMLSSAPQGTERAAPRHSLVAISGNDRDRLLGRLAAGAKNAELAAEFGLSSKQVHGIRMGCARDIASRREQL